MDIVLGIEVHQFLSITQVALRRTVFQHLAVDVLQRVEAALRRGQVGLSDVEVINLYATLLGSKRQGGKLSNG